MISPPIATSALRTPSPASSEAPSRRASQHGHLVWHRLRHTHQIYIVLRMPSAASVHGMGTVRQCAPRQSPQSCTQEGRPCPDLVLTTWPVRCSARHLAVTSSPAWPASSRCAQPCSSSPPAPSGGTSAGSTSRRSGAMPSAASLSARPARRPASAVPASARARRVRRRAGRMMPAPALGRRAALAKRCSAPPPAVMTAFRHDR